MGGLTAALSSKHSTAQQQQHNPLIDGLQRLTLGRVRNFDIAGGEFVQILHTGTDHWLCISSIGCSPGVVHLFDSFYNDVILRDRGTNSRFAWWQTSRPCLCSSAATDQWQ